MNNTKKGFTLIELMVVIVILGILSMIGITAFRSSQVRARDSKKKSDLENLQKALEFYYNDKGSYPLASNGEMVGCGDGTESCDWGAEFSDEKGTIYMIRLPKEANSSNQYFYVTDGLGSYYQLYARLENTEDQDIPQPGGSYTGTDCGIVGIDIECNYGVASVNSTP